MEAGVHTVRTVYGVSLYPLKSCSLPHVRLNIQNLRGLPLNYDPLLQRLRN
jgi:hypothetical protein